MAKTNATCSVDDCDRPFHAKTWCSYHYKRNYATGCPTTPRRQHPEHAHAAHKRQCAVAECATVVGRSGAKGLCTTHYSRFRKHGDPGPAGRLTTPRSMPCTVDGCGQESYSRGLCRNHRYRLSMTGTTRRQCLHCAADMTNTAHARKFCSAAHAAAYRRHGGARPASLMCQRCGDNFSTTALGVAGRAKRTDAKMCAECRRGRATRHGWSVKALVAHTGITDCGICGDRVDLTLRKPHMMRPSIDHIVPYAHGGPNDVENLQLAHLHCNHVKSDSGWARGKRVIIRT